MEAPLTVVVSTVYALSMAKHVCVQLAGKENWVRLIADKVEQRGDNWVVSHGSNQIGQFAVSQVQGWWIEDATDKMR